jgi:imidazolonepropionase-like amidohydrolase
MLLRTGIQFQSTYSAVSASARAREFGMPGEDVADWIDKLAIGEVIARYSNASTRGAWDEFESLWAVDGVWEVAPPVGTKVVGARAIREAASANVDSADFLFQMTHDTVINLSGRERASATTIIHVFTRREGHHNVMNLAVFYDDLIKEDGAWKFSRRVLQPIYMDTSDLAGKVIVPRGKIA